MFGKKITVFEKNSLVSVFSLLFSFVLLLPVVTRAQLIGPLIGGPTGGTSETSCCNGTVYSFDSIDPTNPALLDGEAIYTPGLSQIYENFDISTPGHCAVGLTQYGICLDPEAECYSGDVMPIIINVGTSADTAYCQGATAADAAAEAGIEGAGAAGAGDDEEGGDSGTNSNQSTQSSDSDVSSISLDELGIDEGSGFDDGSTSFDSGSVSADSNQTSALSGGSNSRDNNNTIDYDDAVGTQSGNTNNQGSIDRSTALGTSGNTSSNSQSGSIGLQDAVGSNNIDRADYGVIDYGQATQYYGSTPSNYSGNQSGSISLRDAVTPANGISSADRTFDANLRRGSRGEDVRALQQFLNNNGYTVAQSGAGSPGNETDYFGPATERALAEYQLNNGLGGQNVSGRDEFGAFGPETRGDINDYYTDYAAVGNQVAQQFPISQNLGPGDSYLSQVYANNPYNNFNQGDNYVANLFPSSQNSGTNQVNNLFQNPGSGYRDDILRLQNPAPSQYRFQENQGIVRGNNNAEIGRLQDYLVGQNAGPAARELSDALADGRGIYGGKTEAAVREFQEANNLHITGQFDNETRGYINGEQVTGIGDIVQSDTSQTAGRSQGDQLTRSLFDSSRYDAQTGLMQDKLAAAASGPQAQRLADVLENSPEAKGYFGPLTGQALSEYQASQGLPQTGFLDHETRRRLNGGTTGDPSILPGGEPGAQNQYVRATFFQAGEANSDYYTDRGQNFTGSGLRNSSPTQVGSAAVPPSIPHGSKIIVNTPDGPRYFIADDIGGAVTAGTASQKYARDLGLGSNSAEYNAPVIDFYADELLTGGVWQDVWQDVVVVPYDGNTNFKDLSFEEQQRFYNLENFTQLYTNN